MRKLLVLAALVAFAAGCTGSESGIPDGLGQDGPWRIVQRGSVPTSKGSEPWRLYRAAGHGRRECFKAFHGKLCQETAALSGRGDYFATSQSVVSGGRLIWGGAARRIESVDVRFVGGRLQTVQTVDRTIAIPVPAGDAVLDVRAEVGGLSIKCTIRRQAGAFLNCGSVGEP